MSTTTVETEINTMIDEIEAGFAAKDADGVMSHYVREPGGLVVFDLAPPLDDIGFEQNLAKLHTFFGGLASVECRWTQRRVFAGDTVVAVTARLTMTATNVEGAELAHEMRSTLVFVRHGERWLCTHEHDSLPHSFDIPGYAQD